MAFPSELSSPDSPTPSTCSRQASVNQHISRVLTVDGLVSIGRLHDRFRCFGIPPSHKVPRGFGVVSSGRDVGKDAGTRNSTAVPGWNVGARVTNGNGAVFQ